MSINVIIIAILALVVLAVLIFIFTGRSKIFTSSVSQTCQVQGGKCKANVDVPCGQGEYAETYLIYARGCKVDAKTGASTSDPEEKATGPCCVPFK